MHETHLVAESSLDADKASLHPLSPLRLATICFVKFAASQVCMYMVLHVLGSVKSCMSSRWNGNQCQEDDSKDISKRNERLLTPLDIHQTIWQCNCFSVSKLRMGSVNQYPLSAREMLGRSLNENVTYNMVNLHLLQKLVCGGMAYFDVFCVTLMYLVFSFVCGHFLTV